MGLSRQRDASDRASIALVGATLLVQPLLNLPATPLPITAAEAWAPDRMWREDAEAGQVGATWTGEFLPLTVREQRWALGRPREGATDGPALDPLPTVQILERGYDRVILPSKAERAPLRALASVPSARMARRAERRIGADLPLR